MKLPLLVTPLLLSSFVFASCGGSGGSGVDSAKTSDKLTSDEKITECEFLRAAVDVPNLQKLFCTIDGLSQASQGGDCQKTIDTCIAANKPAFEKTCAEDTAAADPACASMFTVGEVEKCSLAMVDYFNGLSITCASSQADLDKVGNPPTPAACTAIAEKCPELIIGNNDGGDGSGGSDGSDGSGGSGGGN